MLNSIRRGKSSKAILLCLMALVPLSGACGGRSEAGWSPSTSDVKRPESAAQGAGAETPAEEGAQSEPGSAAGGVASASDGASASSTEPPPSTEPPAQRREQRSQSGDEASAADRLALELEKRRKAAKARAAAEETPADEEASSNEPAAEPVEGAYTGSDPCRAKSFSVARVREACATGGRPAAKRVMKDAIGKAIATSQSLACKDCHENQRDYTLKPNAVADLERWLEGS